MDDTIEKHIECEEAGAILHGAMTEGFIILSNLGFEFRYKNQRLSQNLFYPWEDIRSATANVSLLNKIGEQFSLSIAKQNDVRFLAKHSAKILKHIADHIGPEHVLRSKKLTDVFIKL